MKTPSFTSLPFLAAGLLLASSALLSAQTYWKGPDGTGGIGDWGLATNWSNDAAPDGTETVRFDYSTGTYSSRNATITIGEGVEAKALGISIRYGKQITFLLEDKASLTTSGNLTFTAGNGTTTAAGAVGMTIMGPESGSAQVNLSRIYLEANTGERNTLEFSGPNLEVELTGPNYQHLINGTSLIISNGAKVNGINFFREDEEVMSTTGDFHIRATGANGLNNRVILEDGTLSGNRLYAYAGALIQLSKNSVLEASDTTMSLYINSGAAANGARFELEGDGRGASVHTRVYNNGVLAVGLGDPDTGARTEAGKLTLSSTVQLDSGSILEISIFGSGNAGIDQIDLNTSAATMLDIRTGALLNLKLNGYTPTLGESWTLFTGETSKIVGIFNLSLIDPEVWDLSNFNEAGGWVIVSQIPEPSGVALLCLSGTGMIALLRNLRHRRA